MDTSASDFVDRLSESQLLTPSQRESLASEASQHSTGKQLATALVRRRLLTRWQAEQLLFGRTTFQLGDYVLRRKVGGGATGAVYEVVHYQTAERRALKVLSPELALDDQYLQGFRREVGYLKRLDHPAIVKCFLADRVGDTEFLVMEFISGPDLGTWLKSQRAVTPTLASRMIEPVAAGLQHVHENGLVHRDIKPSNLMLYTDPNTRKPILKIVDFGIARHRLAESSESTPNELFVGSLDYMAPEQFENASDVDIRADIFSLGATLFTMLSGRELTSADRVSEKLSERLANAPSKIRSVFPKCPPAFASVIDRCLELDPANRFDTPADVAEALRLARSKPASHLPSATSNTQNIPTQSPRSVSQEDELSDDSASDLDDFLPALVTRKRESPSEKPITPQTARFAPRIGRIMRLAIVASLLSVVVASGAARSRRASVRILWNKEDQTEGSQLVINEEAIPISADGQTEVWLPPGRVNLRLERMGFDSLQQELSIGWGDRLIFTPEWTPTTLLAERRTLQSLVTRWNRQTTLRPDHPDQRELRSRLATALSQDLGRTLRGEFLRLMATIPSEFEQRIEEEFAARPDIEWTLGSRRFQHSAAVSDVAFAPDAKRFATAGKDGIVQVYAMQDGGRLRTISLPVPVQRIRFLNNTRLLIAASSGVLFALDVEKHRRIDFAAPRASPAALCVSKQTDHFAVGYTDNKLRIYQTAQSEPIKTIVFSHFVNAIEWSTDGGLLAAADARGITKVWDRTTDKVHALPKSVPARLLAFGPDGTTLTLYGANFRRADYSIENLDEVPPPKLSGSAAVAQVASDGSWRVELPSPAKRTSVEVVGIDFSQRLRDFPTVAKYSLPGWVAVGFKDGSVELYSTLEDKLPQTHGSQAEQWTAVAISQDGSKFALGARNGQVHLFDAYTRRRIQSDNSTEVRNHNDAIQFLNFCNQDQDLISFDGTSLVVAKVADVSSHRSFPASTPVVCSRDASVCCYRVEKGVVLYDARLQAERLFETTADTLLMAMLPDASRIAILDGSILRVLNARTGVQEAEHKLMVEGQFSTLSFLSQNRLFIGGEPSVLVSINPFRQTTVDPSPIGDPLVSSHSNRFVTVQGAVHRLDATGKPIPSTERRWPPDADPLDFDVTPNERFILYVDGTGEVTLIRRTDEDEHGRP